MMMVLAVSQRQNGIESGPLTCKKNHHVQRMRLVLLYTKCFLGKIYPHSMGEESVIITLIFSSVVRYIV
jgi:hypothetical protein